MYVEIEAAGPTMFMEFVTVSVEYGQSPEGWTMVIHDAMHHTPWHAAGIDCTFICTTCEQKCHLKTHNAHASLLPVIVVNLHIQPI